MIAVKELSEKYTRGLFDDSIHAMMDDGYQFVDAQLSFEMLRRTLMDGQPLVLATKGGPMFVFGEDEGKIYFYLDGQAQEVRDEDLEKVWSGRAAIITGRNVVDAGVGGMESIIYDPDTDTWPANVHEFKQAAKQTLTAFDQVPFEYRPAHPVIIHFQRAEGKMKKEGVRAYTTGADVYLFDHTDPVTEALHEIGHAYYWTRLSEDDMKTCKDLHDGLKSMKRMPSVFTDRWGMSSPEEMFATVYVWFVKGQMIHPGYRQILDFQFPQGAALIEDVAMGIRDNFEIHKAWKLNERKLGVWLESACGEKKKFKVGSRILKAKKVVEIPKVDRIPTGGDILYEFEGRKWVTVPDGLLKGRTFIVGEDGRIDYAYMESRGENLHLVPVRKNYVRGDKLRTRLRYVDIGEFIA